MKSVFVSFFEINKSTEMTMTYIVFRKLDAQSKFILPLLHISGLLRRKFNHLHNNFQTTRHDPATSHRVWINRHASK